MEPMKNGQSRENGSQRPSIDTNGTGGRYNCSPGVDKKFGTFGGNPDVYIASGIFREGKT